MPFISPCLSSRLAVHTLPSSLNGLVQQLTSGLLNRKTALEFCRTRRTFAARTLQIANSPASASKPFERIEDAVDRLGANSLGWLALTVCLPGSLLKDSDEDVLENSGDTRFARHLQLEQRHHNAKDFLIRRSHVRFCNTLASWFDPAAWRHT